LFEMNWVVTVTAASFPDVLATWTFVGEPAPVPVSPPVAR